MAKDRIESKYVTVAPGVELHILEKGEGKPLVFIPGLTFSGEIFKNQLEYFSSEYRVIAIDPRGQGYSAKTVDGNDYLIRLFRDDPEVTAVALPAFRYQCFAILLQPVIVVTNMTFQSVGKAGRATFLACCRQGVCFIPLILVLPRVLGLVGVELCQPIADALTFFISLPFLLAFLRQLEQMDKAEASHAPAQL